LRIPNACRIARAACLRSNPQGIFFNFNLLKHEEVAIYAVNCVFRMLVGLREQLACAAIRWASFAI